MEEAKWYVAHTYSGYENKVKVDIEKTIESRGLQEQILEVCVPMEEVTELKNGKEKVSYKKLFPGYVLIHMYKNDETWFIVRNTRGVTGFVGPGGKETPLSEEEIEALGLGDFIKKDEPKKVIINFEIGDLIVVKSGPWEGTLGVVQSINEQKQTLSIKVDMFGRETLVELEFGVVRKKD